MTISTCPDSLCNYRNALGYCTITSCIHKPVQKTAENVEVNIVNCNWCDELEAGDSLYKHGSDDRGILFDEIRNIKYCPVCGKALKRMLRRGE